MKAKKFKKLKNISMLKSMVLVALSDGKLDFEELEFLKRKAEEFQIKEADLNAVLMDPEKIKTVFPEALGEKIELLYELVEMMLKDGIVTSEEMETCQSIAVKMEIFPGSVYQILKDIEKNLVKAA